MRQLDNLRRENRMLIQGTLQQNHPDLRAHPYNQQPSLPDLVDLSSIATQNYNQYQSTQSIASPTNSHIA